MKKLEEIDHNFVQSEDNSEFIFHDIRTESFQIYGLYEPQKEGPFRRFPEEVARRTSESVYELHTITAGGRVRFRTDSQRIAVRASLGVIWRMAHMSLALNAGFALYEVRGGEEQYLKTFLPPVDVVDSYETSVDLKSQKERDLVLYFPNYGGVEKLEIGLVPGTTLGVGNTYANPLPIVFYGSSITQGGCASRPGNDYIAMISRRLHCDVLNLGFSGNAKGETAMAEYIASLPMRAFVLDYDHNAPDADHLRRTHELFFQIIRKHQPELPVVFVTRPKLRLDAQEVQRRGIVFRTYQNAIAAGDRHVYFVSGSQMFARTGGGDCTVDGTHPNDLGFFYMAETIGAALEEALRG